MFQKANPEQAYLKVGLYGPPGSGKTFTALLLAEGLAALSEKRIALVDTERGSDFYAMRVPSRQVHQAGFDFDALYTRSLAATLEAVRAPASRDYGVFIIDSITHLWEAAIGSYEGRMTKADTIPMRAWGRIKKPYKELIRFLLDAPAHVIICGRQKNIFENPDGDADRMVKVGVGMKAEGETEYEPHICARFEHRAKPDGTLAGVAMIVEKDRTGVLSGRTFVNPSFTTFEPLLPLLGATQARSEDPDEVTARDSELLEKQEAVAKDKEEKSRARWVGINSAIVEATSLEALAQVATQIKKERRYMTEEHVDALRQMYAVRQRELAAEVAPTEV